MSELKRALLAATKEINELMDQVKDRMQELSEEARVDDGLPPFPATRGAVHPTLPRRFMEGSAVVLVDEKIGAQNGESRKKQLIDLLMEEPESRHAKAVNATLLYGTFLCHLVEEGINLSSLFDANPGLLEKDKWELDLSPCGERWTWVYTEPVKRAS